MNRKSALLFLSLFSLLMVALVGQEARVSDPDPSRFHEEIDTFVQWDRKNSWPDNAILFVGSSSIRLWKTREAFPEKKIINRGFGGAHISDVLHYYEKVVQPYKPGVIVFYCGDNDIASGKTVERVYDDFLSFLTRVFNEIPAVRVVYVPIKPSGSRWTMWPEMKKVNNKIKLLSKKERNLIYIDTATPLLDTSGKPDDRFFLDDKLHLNEPGYQEWNQVLHPVLAELSGE
jgi:lysophospholipase L1-like esterase